jgi:hypothetical protein
MKSGGSLASGGAAAAGQSASFKNGGAACIGYATHRLALSLKDPTWMAASMQSPVEARVFCGALVNAAETMDPNVFRSGKVDRERIQVAVRNLAHELNASNYSGEALRVAQTMVSPILAKMKSAAALKSGAGSETAMMSGLTIGNVGGLKGALTDMAEELVQSKQRGHPYDFSRPDTTPEDLKEDAAGVANEIAKEVMSDARALATGVTDDVVGAMVRAFKQANRNESGYGDDLEAVLQKAERNPAGPKSLSSGAFLGITQSSRKQVAKAIKELITKSRPEEAASAVRGALETLGKGKVNKKQAGRELKFALGALLTSLAARVLQRDSVQTSAYRKYK